MNIKKLLVDCTKFTSYLVAASVIGFSLGFVKSEIENRIDEYKYNLEQEISEEIKLEYAFGVRKIPLRSITYLNERELEYGIKKREEFQKNILEIKKWKEKKRLENLIK